MHIRWAQLQSQIGTAYVRPRVLGTKIANVLPDVISVYPEAKVELTTTGITLHPSPPAVPDKTIVNGFKLISSR